MDFRDAEMVFAGPVLVIADETEGEMRFSALGFLEDVLVCVASSMRGEEIRVISMRKATPAERRTYAKETAL